jgi:hypothetical protein
LETLIMTILLRFVFFLRVDGLRLFAGVIWAHIICGTCAIVLSSAVLQAWRKPVFASYPVALWSAVLLGAAALCILLGGVSGWVTVILALCSHCAVVLVQYCCRVYMCCPQCLRRCALCCCITPESIAPLPGAPG